MLAGTGGEPPDGASARERRRLRVMGGAIAAAVSALDVAGSLPAGPWRGLSVGSQLLDGWGVRLLGGLALLSLAGVRARRARALAAPAHARPALGCVGALVRDAVCARRPVRAVTGRGRPAPGDARDRRDPGELPVGAAGTAVLFSVILLFVLAWGLRAYARRRTGGQTSGPPPPLGAGTALLATTTAVAFLIWLVNPYASLLLVLPAHAWLVALTREERRGRAIGLLVIVLSLAPLAAAIALLCAGLGVSPFGLLWTLVVFVGSSGVSVADLLLASLAAGCAVAAAAALLAPAPPPPRRSR